MTTSDIGGSSTTLDAKLHVAHQAEEAFGHLLLVYWADDLLLRDHEGEPFMVSAGLIVDHDSLVGHGTLLGDGFANHEKQTVLRDLVARFADASADVYQVLLEEADRLLHDDLETYGVGLKLGWCSIGGSGNGWHGLHYVKLDEESTV